MPKQFPEIKPENRPKHRLRGKNARLTVLEKEAFYQTYLVLKNVSAACRAHHISRPTGDKILKEYRAKLSIPDQIQIEKKVDEMLKSRTYEVTNQLLDSIRPEDMESGRFPIRNDKGEVTGYKEFGPSLLQKATSFGIMVDKIKVQTDLQRAADMDISSGNLLIPDSADQLLRAITSQVKSLQIAQINFREDAPDLATRVDAALEVDRVEVEDVTDKPLSFDNP
jgi:hypothetical protein